MIRLLVAASLFSLPCAALAYPPAPSCPDSCTTTVIPAGPIVDTWTAAGSPYCVLGDLQIASLTIEPGVCVLVDGPFEIEVIGTLDANGTENDPIMFTAKDPGTPWKGLSFTNAGASTLEYCWVTNSDDHGVEVTSTAVTFDHCVIADNSAIGEGGGVLAELGDDDLVFADSWIAENFATNHGGGMNVTTDVGILIMERSMIVGNQNDRVGSGTVNNWGGGLYLFGSGALTDCVVIGNVAQARCTGASCNGIGRGGGLYSESGDLTISRGLFAYNRAFGHDNDSFGTERATSYGGALFISSGSCVISGTVFACNAADALGSTEVEQGSAVYASTAGGTATVYQCTFARNAPAPAIYDAAGTTTVTNSIVYLNNSGGVQVGGSPTIEYSDVEGGYPGTGNIDQDPLFAGLRYNLLSVSPCVDMADPAGGDDACLPPAHGTTDPDMGAYGGPDNCGWENHPYCPVDLNFDGSLNGIDVGLFLQNYFEQNDLADLNCDNAWNGLDVGLFLAAYSEGC